MSQPFSGIPDPRNSSPFKRRSPQSMVQETLREMWREARRRGDQLMRAAQLHGGNLRVYARRHPRAIGLTAGAVALTLVGAYALNASGRSLCPSADSKGPRFLLLMDPVPPQTSGSELTINYDVCGLKAGTPFRGKVKLTQAQRAPKNKKKKAPKPQVTVISFQGKSEGLADRRRQEQSLWVKPGTYTLEFSVTDNAGRERKRVQKLVVKPQ